jgi:RimJ/RimL family protein N-acetyltransferase
MIETKTTLLRPLEPSDLDRLYRYRNDREVARHLGGFSTGYARADLAAWLEAHRNRADEVLWAIATKHDDTCIGHAGLYRIDYRVRKAEYAILIGDREHQGKGIGREVSEAVLHYGFDQLNLHKVSLSVLASNARAIRLYQALGFVQEGVLRHDQFRDGGYVDSIVMSIIEGEWG